MEGGVHRGSWNKKGHVGTILLLMCVFIPSLTSLCPDGDYPNDKGICCNKCPPGFRLTEQCHTVGQRSNCSRCPDRQFMDQINFFPNCRRCKSCKEIYNEVVESPCQKEKNTICRCADGYYKVSIFSEKYDCRKCTQCGSNEKQKQACTPVNNTVCECTENFYRVNKVCVPCNNCTTECKHHCSLPTEDPYYPYVHKGLIAGVAAAVLVLLVLVFFITYTATKWSTKKKLLKSSSQPSDASLDTCQQILMQSEEPSNNTVRAVPSSEQDQPSNLPDCVPLEIKIPDVIYMVLDLVPVLQVKQLVRYLGVKDTEIEQAELDHRSTREAHYQMLRVWAERGSRGGGRGGMLHWHLLQELMDELKKMHLGRAAEELGTKYGIQ